MTSPYKLVAITTPTGLLSISVQYLLSVVLPLDTEKQRRFSERTNIKTSFLKHLIYLTFDFV